VVPSLISAVFTLVTSHLLLPGIRNRFAWDRQAKQAMLRFGRWIFASTLLTFLAAQSDRLVFGRLIPLSLLGVYGIALTLATMPTQAILRIGGMVVFPAYSEANADSIRFKRVFARVRVPLIVCGAMGITALIASGPALVRVMYRPAYWEAGWILQLLAVVAWFQILECTNGSALLARGSAQWVAAGNAAKLIGMISFIPLGYSIAPRFGIGAFYGAILGLVAAEMLKYSVSAFAVRRQGLAVLGIDFLCSLFIAVGAAGAILATRYFKLPGARDWAIFTMALFVAFVIWLPIGGWLIARKLEFRWSEFLRARASRPHPGI
jgi:O-antigen/teichoic acid export membrane protein